MRLTRASLTDLHRQLMTVRSAAWRRVFCLCTLGEVCIEAGELDQARCVMASIGDADRQAFCAPEIYRIEGEIFLRERADSEAEAHFRAAIDLARERGEKSLELRAATSLARLWRQQGKPAEACGVLADVYGWFTEGFDTTDLRVARALLDELKA